MTSKLQDKTGKVLVVDSASSARQLLADVVKGLGFQDVTGVSNVKDALGMLEVEPVDWIITPVEKGSEVNALQILKLITQYPALRPVRMSLLIEESEKDYLSWAYSFGLLSHHEKPFNKDSLSNSFGLLLKRLEESQFDTCHASAEFLRDWIKSANVPDIWLAFEKQMSDLYPGNPKQLLRLADSQLASKKMDEGKASLRQATLMDETLKDAAKAVIEAHSPGEDFAAKADAGAAASNVLGIHRVVVVDPDSSAQNSIKQIFGELGVPNVECFDDGENAIAAMKKNPNPDLIIQEWRIPKITGPLFLQMLRKEGNMSSPVIVLSSLLTQEDQPLVREMGVANLATKPFDRANFLKSVIWTIQQDKLPTDAQVIERKIREYLSTKKHIKAAELKAKYLAIPGIAAGRKKLIEAEFAFVAEDYTGAKSLAFEALKMGADNMIIMNLLGKTLMKLRDFQSALTCFEKAQSMSPLNIERLCKMAEVHSELGNDEKAAETIKEAKSIEEKHRSIDESDAKIAVTKGDTDKAKAIMSKMESLDEVIAYMNNRAVALAKSGDIDAGIAQYRKTIQSLPDEREEIRALVYYNLGLAYARSGDLEESKVALEKTVKGKSTLKRKAESLRKRLEHAIKSGEPLSLRSDDHNDEMKVPEHEQLQNKAPQDATNGTDSVAAAATVNQDVVAAVQTSKRELCCYMIYNDPRDTSADVKTMVANLPRFNSRAAISRGATMGADKNLKNAS
jgi:CheY-like chemotaxis protein/Flp pilus assembly protein TadD